MTRHFAATWLKSFEQWVEWGWNGTDYKLTCGEYCNNPPVSLSFVHINYVNPALRGLPQLTLTPSICSGEVNQTDFMSIWKEIFAIWTTETGSDAVWIFQLLEGWRLFLTESRSDASYSVTLHWNTNKRKHFINEFQRLLWYVDVDRYISWCFDRFFIFLLCLLYND